MFHWSDVALGIDSTRFSVRGADTLAERRAISTAAIREVVVRSRSKGALEGLGIGALSGALAGITLLLTVEDVFCSDTAATSCESPSIAEAAGGGAFGGMVGGR